MARARTDDEEALDAISSGRAADPFALLGPHRIGPRRSSLVVRTMQPSASAVELVTPDRVLPMSRVRDEGLF